MIKAVFDTNVIISGSIAHSGGPYQALQAWRQGDIILLISKPIIDELADVLQRPFFRYKRHIKNTDIAKLRSVLLTDAVVVSPRKHLEIIEADPDDNRILECAVEGSADCIVSGDHHLLKLKNYKDIQIITVQEFLAILQSKS